MPVSPLVDALVSDYEWPDATITFAFVDAGEATYKGSYEGGSDFTSGWSTQQKDVVRDIYDHVSDFTRMTFSEENDPEDAYIDFQLVASVPGGWAGYAGYPSTYWGSNIVIGNQYLQSGTNGTSNVTVHEIGHALGLEHTHDGSDAFPHLSGYSDLGDYSLNNQLFSVMSYNRPHDPEHSTLQIYADQVKFMAFDIAALQEIYGAKAQASGHTQYGQTDLLQSIWDTGGTDTIDFSTAVNDAVIDLRAASLQNEAGGGGYLSFVYQQSSNTSTGGGYTIANGVAIENADGGAGDDALTGNHLANTIKGHNGDDTLFGGAGKDTLKGGSGHDVIEGQKNSDIMFGGHGNDKLVGGIGDDTLYGNAGRDKIEGGAGKDKLNGQKGNDKMWGGNGADRFVFGKGSDKDVIKDFADEVDTIRINGFGTKSNILSKALNIGDDVVIDFGDGDILTILNTRISEIRDDILT